MSRVQSPFKAKYQYIACFIVCYTALLSIYNLLYIACYIAVIYQSH